MKESNEIFKDENGEIFDVENNQEFNNGKGDGDNE